MVNELKKSTTFKGAKGPVLTIVMDGVGIAPDNGANAVKAANTPTLDMLMRDYPMVPLKAHGTAVGLPSDDDMGNSEVGHNALGAGKVFAQGAKLVTQSIESGKIFASETWKTLVARVLDGAHTLHFIGLFSDGNVHSHIDHLKAMILQAKKDGSSLCKSPVGHPSCNMPTIAICVKKCTLATSIVATTTTKTTTRR